MSEVSITRFDLNIPVATRRNDDLDEVVTKQKKIMIRFDYPLNGQYDFAFQSDEGFTVGRVINLVRQTYAEIYDNDDKYGVWGHEVEDLVIEGFEFEGGVVHLAISS